MKDSFPDCDCRPPTEPVSILDPHRLDSGYEDLDPTGDDRCFPQTSTPTLPRSGTGTRGTRSDHTLKDRCGTGPGTSSLGPYPLQTTRLEDKSPPTSTPDTSRRVRHGVNSKTAVDSFSTDKEETVESTVIP